MQYGLNLSKIRKNKLATKIKCPKCGLEYLVNQNEIGTQFDCTGCDSTLEVPEFKIKKRNKIRSIVDIPLEFTPYSKEGSLISGVLLELVAFFLTGGILQGIGLAHCGKDLLYIKISVATAAGILIVSLFTCWAIFPSALLVYCFIAPIKLIIYLFILFFLG